MNLATAATLLEGARHRVDKGYTQFICIGLADTEQDFYDKDDPLPEGEETLVDLTDYIEAQLVSSNSRHHSTLRDYLEEQLSGTFLSYLTMEQARLAWIDRMLHNLTTKGTLP